MPVLGDRQDPGHLRLYVDAKMQAQAAPEVTTWPLWMQRLIALTSRVAEGVHATADPDERARRQDRLQRAEAAFDPLPFDNEAARAIMPAEDGHQRHDDAETDEVNEDRQENDEQ